MGLVYGAALSYSPLFYRPRSRWESVAALLRGAVPQPSIAGDETELRLDAFAPRLIQNFERIKNGIRGANLDALVVLVADRNRFFNDANVPALHLFAENEIWGDPALSELSEAAAIVTLACDRELAELLDEELVFDGFDLAASRTSFRPLGDPDRGVTPSLIEPVIHLAGGLPIVPVHCNCHVEPAISGERMHEFGKALTAALAFSDKRVGLLASGGLSGDPRGYLAGWVDDVLDSWVLRRFATGRSADVGHIWNVESQSLRGAAAEMRLWVALGSAMEAAGARARVLDYFPFYHAAVGAGFVQWELRS